MGSPIAPVLVNLFLAHYEKQGIEEFQHHAIVFYKRYVADISCLVENETVAEDFLSYLNSKHPNIKFTIKIENENKLPFLDVLNIFSDIRFLTIVFRKTTFTELFLNFTSFTPLCYKIALTKTFLHRTFKTF